VEYLVFEADFTVEFQAAISEYSLLAYRLENSRGENLSAHAMCVVQPIEEYRGFFQIIHQLGSKRGDR
jgi:hypothetical protein